jgi:hypothetical protein
MSINRKATMAKRQREMEQKDRVKEREQRRAERKVRQAERVASGVTGAPIDELPPPGSEDADGDGADGADAADGDAPDDTMAPTPDRSTDRSDRGGSTPTTGTP